MSTCSIDSSISELEAKIINKHEYGRKEEIEELREIQNILISEHWSQH